MNNGSIKLMKIPADCDVLASDENGHSPVGVLPVDGTMWSIWNPAV